MSIKDAVRPGIKDWWISSETAKRIRPTRIKKKAKMLFFDSDPSKDFSHRKVSNAYAGLWARFEMICSLKDPFPHRVLSGMDDMQIINKVLNIARDRYL